MRPICERGFALDTRKRQIELTTICSTANPSRFTVFVVRSPSADGVIAASKLTMAIGNVES